ncbi:DHS-like NAD/FAD-binding domain-containing protein [Phycomyces nitens]|nr:DHS-like NAD/FAD-binding domain-containing protein [Phycomyces nitens]
MTGTKTKKTLAVLKDKSLNAVVDYIKEKKVKNVIVMSGAGISTAAGIPDFRTKGTGLYDNLQKFDLPYAEAIFDIDYFMDTPEPFYALAKELYPGRHFPTKVHYFIRLLDEKKILLRNYTQNIDTLERLSGLSPDRIVEAHGSFATASCVECNKTADPVFIKKKALKAEVARCPECDGLIKPDITFFGQSLPKRFHDNLSDFDHADLLIVIGTSLMVHPFAGLIDHVPGNVPRLLINMDEAGVHKSPQHGFDFKWKYGKKRDVAVLGPCDESIEKMADLLGWREELETLYKEGTEKLKAQWELEKDQKEIEEKKEAAVDIVDTLANELDKKLKVISESEQ